MEALVSLSLEVFELLNWRHWLRDSHSVFLVQQQKLFLIVCVDSFDLVH